MALIELAFNNTYCLYRATDDERFRWVFKFESPIEILINLGGGALLKKWDHVLEVEEEAANPSVQTLSSQKLLVRSFHRRLGTGDVAASSWAPKSFMALIRPVVHHAGSVSMDRLTEQLEASEFHHKHDR